MTSEYVLGIITGVILTVLALALVDIYQMWRKP